MPLQHVSDTVRFVVQHIFRRAVLLVGLGRKRVLLLSAHMPREGPQRLSIFLLPFSITRTVTHNSILRTRANPSTRQ